MRAVVACLAVLLLCATSATGVRFALAPGTRRCFTEDLPTATRVAAEVRVSDGKGAMDIDVWVTTLTGRVLYHKRAPDHGKFSFTTAAATKTEHSGIDSEETDDEEYGWVDETYRFCVEHQKPVGAVMPADATRIIAFKVDDSSSAAGGGGTPGLAKQAAADRLALAMRKIHESLGSVIVDLTQLQQRERKLVHRVANTNTRLSLLSGLAIAVTVVTSAVQYRYFKAYFTQKKLC
jgi:hypothetical protein